MNAVEPLLIGRRQLDRLAAQLAPALAALATRWWTDIEPAPAAIEPCGADRPPRQEAARYLLRNGADWLACYGTERHWLALAEGWLGCPVETASLLVQHLTRAFCRELFTAVAGDGAATVEEWVRPQQLPATPPRRLLRLELAFDGIPLALLGAAAAWSAPLAPAGGRALPLERCAAALGATAVRLQVTLPPARMPLADLANLAVGDFLDLGLDLSGRVQLRGPDPALCLTAEVGRRQDRKAVRILNIAPEHTP